MCSFIVAYHSSACQGGGPQFNYVYFGRDSLKCLGSLVVENTFLTSSMGFGFDDLTNASGTHTVLGGQFDLVPGATTQIVQFERSLGRTDEHVPPLLCVVH